MATMEIAVEIGTSYTSIYLSGSGLVLREPTVVAYTGAGERRKVRAVGNKAIEMLGKTPERTLIVSPVVDGVIVDPDTCAVLLRAFIGRIVDDGYSFFRPRIKAILAVPMGLEKKQYKTYEDVCFAADISEVTTIESIILAGVGIDMPLTSPHAGLVVNIGGGATEIAALSLCGIIDGYGVSIGGNMMDNALIDYISGKKSLRLGTNTARKLKHDIGGDIYRSGIYLTGGASQITGLPEFLKAKLQLPVYLVEDPSFAVILGAGKLLSNDELLAGILAQK